MGARDRLETDTRVIDAPDVSRETAESPRGEVLADPERRREESAESQQRVDGNGESRPFKVNRDELAGFDLLRRPAGHRHRRRRQIHRREPDVPPVAGHDRSRVAGGRVRIIAAMDTAGGHAHIRHEGWVTEEANRRRIACRKEPAQLDPEKEVPGHRWSPVEQTQHSSVQRPRPHRITDPDAFATAFVRGVGRIPKFEQALSMAFNSSTGPTRSRSGCARNCWVRMATVDCRGWRLEPEGRQHEGRCDQPRQVDRSKVEKGATP